MIYNYLCVNTKSLMIIKYDNEKSQYSLQLYTMDKC